MGITLRCLLVLCSLFSLYAGELEIIVPKENVLLPITVSLHADIDTQHQQELHTLYRQFTNDLALGDKLQPIQRETGLAPFHLSLVARYPELTILLKQGNEEPKKICTILLSDSGRNRQAIHEAADQVHYLLTHVPGISAGKIIFSLSKEHRTQGMKQGELWIMDYDGQGLQPLTQDQSLSITPNWLYGDNYVYVSYKLGIPKIFLGSLKEGKGEKILQLPGNQFMPAFSPKKKLLAFISDAYGNPDLFIQSFSPVSGAIGRPRKLFKDPFGTQGNPSFSPDGSKLVFISNRDGHPRLYVAQVYPEIQAPRLLTKKYRNSSCPVWSPDGKKIAFCAVIKGIRQICLYDISSGRDYQLTTSLVNKESPSWALDSNHLVFSAGNSEESELYLLSLITQKSRKLVIGSGEKRFPCWGAFAPQN